MPPDYLPLVLSPSLALHLDLDLVTGRLRAWLVSLDGGGWLAVRVGVA